MEILVEDAITKEAEMEMREEIKRELIEHYEIEKEQIKVDAHVQIETTIMEFEEENAALKDELARLQQVAFERNLYEKQLTAYKQRVRELEQKVRGSRIEQNEEGAASTTCTSGLFTRICM